MAKIWTLFAWGVVVAVVVLGRPCALGEERALKNLPATDKPRFEVSDRVWPAEVGQASICLWNEDRLAAISITIDDNTAPDHAWWLETGKTYGFRFTWFVIAARLSEKGGYFGSPSDFIRLREAGHDVQSHTMDHFNGRGDEALGTEANYQQAIDAINKSVTGARVLTLAYPGGGNARNDKTLAAKYYIAARGTRGHLNAANQVDYMDVNSLSSTMPLDSEHYASLPNLIQLNPKRRGVYRGWASVHFHGLENPKLPQGEMKKKVLGAFDYIRAQGDAFWVAPFTSVAQYGQERDTATVTLKPAGDATWEMTLTDQMDDRLFDHPLTVKVRVDNRWTSVRARQFDAELPARMMDHEGGRYALVQVVPDRGVVTLSPR